MSMLIAPEESDAVIARVKFGRVENFQTQTERIAQGGSGMSENARTKRDKVELNITISREEQEQAFQQTSLRIRTSSVDEKAKELRTVAEKQGGRVRSSTFSRDPGWPRTGKCFVARADEKLSGADAIARLVRQSGERELCNARTAQAAQIDEANAPADISIQVYSQGNIVSHESGPARHAATYTGAKRRRNHVEFAHDWRGDCVSRAVGDCDRRRSSGSRDVRIRASDRWNANHRGVAA